MYWLKKLKSIKKKITTQKTENQISDIYARNFVPYFETD